MSVGSGSRPSTHESQIGVAVESEEIHQELVSQVESTHAEVRTLVRTEHAQAQTGQAETQDEEESASTDLIREFDADLHIIVDPGCRIAIDRFHPNIRDEVKRAYLLKGPTQPRGHARLDGNLITQEHHYCVDTFLAAIDAIITEMDHRFNEVSSELLVCFSCRDLC